MSGHLTLIVAAAVIAVAFAAAVAVIVWENTAGRDDEAVPDGN